MLVMAAFTAIISPADEIKQPDSYYYRRGVEAYGEENYEEATYYFNMELADNPKNGYAHIYLGLIQTGSGLNGDALSSVNKAIKLVPKADKEWLVFAYAIRAQIYLTLTDTIKAMNDLATAIKTDPAGEMPLNLRGQLYYEMGEYDKSDADYRQLLEADESSSAGLMGLVRNASKREDYETAVSLLDRIINLYPYDGRAYSWRAGNYIELKKYNEAVDDYIKALELKDYAARFGITLLDDAVVPLMKVKLKVKAQREPNNPYWPYLLGLLLESKKQYAEAAQYYLNANELNASSTYLDRAANCYGGLGNFPKTIELLTKAQNLDPSNTNLISSLATAYGEAGMLKECLEEWQRFLDLCPDDGWAYYHKGSIEDDYFMTEQAIEDYSMCIMLSPYFYYAYYGRGEMYQRQGKTELAKADYEKVIELDSVPGNNSCAMYAYLALDRKNEAIDFMENVIRQDSLDAGNYYDGACFYSLLGDKPKAISMLRKCLELGFARFSHIDHDDDLDAIRDMEEFKELVETYRLKISEENETEDDYEDEVVEVPFTKEDGITKVKCRINGLPLHFFFDTGAADVTLSMVEANFMLKNDYISENDVIGSNLYMDANGDISEGTVINLRNVNFGGLELTNVRASVVRNQHAPLLLGQSVLGRLGKVEIDNSAMKLKITHPVKK